MGDPPILNTPWPSDLDPADVPFRKRSVTVLKRQGYFDDPSLFDTLTEAEVSSETTFELLHRSPTATMGLRRSSDRWRL